MNIKELYKRIEGSENKEKVHVIADIYEWKGEGIPYPAYCDIDGHLYKEQDIAIRNFKAYKYLQSKGKIKKK